MGLTLLDTRLHGFHVHASLIARIMVLLTRDWSISLVHAYRDANSYADALAKKGAWEGCDWKLW